MKHVVLILEEDPSDATVIRGVVESMGYLAWHVSSREAAREAIRKRGYCAVVADPLMTDDDAPRSRESRTQTLLQEIRATDNRRNDLGSHVLPVILVTGGGQSVEDFDELYGAGASVVVAKPIVPRRELLGRKIDASLRRAGREDHASCERVTATASSRRVHVLLTGERVGRRSGFRLNGEPRDMQHGNFVVFLRFGVAQHHARGGWASRVHLGFPGNPEIPSRIGSAFEGKVPEGFKVIESDWAGSFRLNPEIVVELDLEELAEHPYAAVRKIVKEEVERRARKKKRRGE